MTTTYTAKAKELLGEFVKRAGKNFLVVKVSNVFGDIRLVRSDVTIVVPNRVFHEMQNVGRAKYVVNYHNGAKQHKDGSPFFDIAIFSNKREKNSFVRGLIEQGYTEMSRPS